MPRSNKSHPFLPQELVNKIKSEHSLVSFLFCHPELEQLRFKLLTTGEPTCLQIEIVRYGPLSDLVVPVSLNRFRPLMENLQDFQRGHGKNLLHSAIHDGDVLLSYELLRMGININAKDAEGVTPLFFALEYICSMSKMLEAGRIEFLLQMLPTYATNLQPSIELFELQIARAVRVAILLVEQHADVNAGAFGFTPLSLAAAVAQWDLVEVLLRHGAHPTSPKSLRSASPEYRSKFASLVAQVQAVSPRPPRPCPCWSGKLLSDCHDDSLQLYPEYFLCCCGKRRTFGACCGKRGLNIKERWCQDSGRIVAVQVHSMPPVNILKEVLPPSVASSVDSLEAQFDIRPYWDKLRQELGRKSEFFHKQLVRTGLWDNVDPAYWYAVCKINAIALPWTTVISSLDGQARMKEWNTAIDAYIAEASDGRSTFEIELGAKVDSHGGPLYKRCEAEDCTATEGREVEKMKCCSGCKLILYCSKKCQSQEWKRHKKVCGLKTHPIQLLPTQQVFVRLLAMRDSNIARAIVSEPDFEETIGSLQASALADSVASL